MRRILTILAPSLVLIAIASTAARADQVLYSNDAPSNYSGNASAAGGASLDGTGGSSTALVANEVTVAAGGGGAAVDSISFSVTNLNSAAVTADVDLRFYTVGANGPGTLFATLNFNSISFSTGTKLYSDTPGSTIFSVPMSGSFYVGEFFNNDNALTTTTAQLNNLGEGIFGAPTAGSNPGTFFQGGGGSTNLTSNPSGTNGYYFSSLPGDTFGFGFSGTPLAPVVPVPPSIVMAGSGAGLLGFVRWDGSVGEAAICRSRPDVLDRDTSRLDGPGRVAIRCEPIDRQPTAY